MLDHGKQRTMRILPLLARDVFLVVRTGISLVCGFEIDL